MPLFNCENNLILTRSANCLVSEDDRARNFAITDTKLYLPAVTLSTQDTTNYCSSYHQDSNKQLTGTNINQK